MKIAFITQWYDPEEGSAAIPGAVVRALRHRGHHVEVITGFPNYPHGRIYPGYRVRAYQRETLDGVTVHRVPLYPSHDNSALRRTANFMSFMLSASTIGVAFARRAQVALVYSTPGTVGMAGLVLRGVMRRPFVLYIQDVWPDTVTATGLLPARMIRPVEWLLHRFSNRVYRSAARIGVISPGMKTLLVERGVPAPKIDVVANWVDEDIFCPVPAQGRTRDRFEVMYAGNLGEVQGLDVAVQAIALLGHDSRVVLRLVGSGVARDRLAELADELAVSERVIFEGPRALSEMAAVMASADIQLVCLKDDPLFHLTMPSKIQAILACGRPMITCAPGDAAELTRKAGAGWAVPAGDAASLAEAMAMASSLPHEQLEEMGRQGRKYYETELSSAVGSRKLEEALSAAVETT